MGGDNNSERVEFGAMLVEIGTRESWEGADEKLATAVFRSRDGTFAVNVTREQAKKMAPRLYDYFVFSIAPYDGPR
jgi:hypothetical protein